MSVRVPFPPPLSTSPTFTGLTLSGMTLGSVLFSGTGGLVSQDNANFFWDDANNRLGLGIVTPEAKLHIFKATPAAITTDAGTSIRIDSSGNSYIQFAGSSGGSVMGMIFSRNTTASDGFITYSNATQKLSFGAGSGTRLTATSTGRMGVANDSPNASLEVTSGITTLGFRIASSAGGSLHTADYMDILDNNAASLMQIKQDGVWVLTPKPKSTGSPTLFLMTAPAHTALTASVEAIDINLNLARTVQFSTGAITTQRAMVVQAPTYGAVGASTITTAATFAITGAPVAGTNATLTNTYSLWVQAGRAQFDGIVVYDSTVRLKAYTVATLPVGVQGDTAFVTDALTPAFLTALVGGGAVVTPAFYDGTNWVAM